MAFEKARTALAQLEEKLRRQLGLAGEIGASFEPKLTPVVIAGDLREAGNAANQGRAFAWAFHGAVGGWANNTSLTAAADVYIDQIMLGNAGALQLVRCWITAPDQAPAVATPTICGSWTDRKRVGADQVPLFFGNGVLTGTAEADANRILTAALANAVQVFPVNIMLPVGGALNFTGGGATNLCGVRGRIWP